MNESYKNMRDFWLDVKNLENKKGVQPKDGIYVAGCELALEDSAKKLKNILIAASVLSNSSMYFENNSPSGLGGIAGSPNPKSKELALKVIDESVLMLNSMQSAPALPPPSANAKVVLFAVAKDKVYFKEDDDATLRDPKNPFYKFFAYTQQLVSAFRETEEEPEVKK